MRFIIDNITDITTYDKDHYPIHTADASNITIDVEATEFQTDINLKQIDIGEHIYLSTNIEDKILEIDGCFGGWVYEND